MRSKKTGAVKAMKHLYVFVPDKQIFCDFPHFIHFVVSLFRRACLNYSALYFWSFIATIYIEKRKN